MGHIQKIPCPSKTFLFPIYLLFACKGRERVFPFFLRLTALCMVLLRRFEILLWQWIGGIYGEFKPKNQMTIKRRAVLHTKIFMGSSIKLIASVQPPSQLSNLPNDSKRPVEVHNWMLTKCDESFSVQSKVPYLWILQQTNLSKHHQESSIMDLDIITWDCQVSISMEWTRLQK